MDQPLTRRWLFLTTVPCLTSIISAPELAAHPITWGPPEQSFGYYSAEELLISPGGTLFVVWAGLNGVETGNPDPEDPSTVCDSRLEFPSNAEAQGCPDRNPPEPEFSQTTFQTCPYYYLPNILNSVYVRARYPDGTWAEIETVNVVTAVVGQETLLTDNRAVNAAVGPDGALHVVWVQRVPNLPVEAAAYHAKGGLFNRCSEDADGDGDLDAADLIEWCVASADSDSSCCEGALDSLHADTS